MCQTMPLWHRKNYSHTHLHLSGTNWIFGSNSFSVSNTLWNPTSLQSYSGNALVLYSSIPADSKLVVTPGYGFSNSIYYGLRVPYTAHGTYTQNIMVENSC